MVKSVEKKEKPIVLKKTTKELKAGKVIKDPKPPKADKPAKADKPPRKKSAYLEFTSKNRKSVAKKNPGVGPKDMMRLLAKAYQESKPKV